MCPVSTLPSCGQAFPCGPGSSGPRGRLRARDRVWSPSPSPPVGLSGEVQRRLPNPAHLPPPLPGAKGHLGLRGLCPFSLPGRSRGRGSNQGSQREGWTSGHVSEGHRRWS